jgi:DNA modification methylase
MSAPVPFYQDEAVCVYHADCREVLPFLPKCDLLLTDPPYGIGEAAGKNASRSKPFGGRANGLSHEGRTVDARDYGRLEWDSKPPPRWLFDALMEHTTHQIIFGGNYFGLPASSCWLVWDKDNGESDFADCELAWTNLHKAVRRINYRWNGMLQEPGVRKEHRVHPTQKPEAVMRWALLQAPDGCSVLDPFMGSGTTLVAAKRLGRKAIGIERERSYCEMAVERLRQSALPLEMGA